MKPLLSRPPKNAHAPTCSAGSPIGAGPRLQGRWGTDEPAHSDGEAFDDTSPRYAELSRRD